ncbi:hypothetical protein ACF0H5_000687 [Mactra antiquata]
MGKTLLRKFTAGFVITAFLLQAASIAAPGWLIEIDGNLEHGESLFYKATCHVLNDQSSCKVKSFQDLYTKERNKLVAAKVSRQTLAKFDFFYHVLVCKQSLAMIAVSFTLIAVLIQVAMFVRRDRHNVRLTVLSAVLSAVTAGILVTMVCYEVVGNHYKLELRSMDSKRDHTYVGFPYCLAMLVGAALLLLFSDISTACLLYTAKPPKKKTYDDDDDDDDEPITKSGSPSNTEFTLSTKSDSSKLTDVPASKPKRTYMTIPTLPTVPKSEPVVKEPIVKTTQMKEQGGQDNPVFSEKL